MENIFVEFLPPWVETGLQPAFYDKESGTVLQQTARMYARVNMLIRMFNKLSKNTKEEIESFEQSVTETVNEYIEKFNDLHDYVYDYFDNLDVQEEINNKLDEMLEDGTLEEIIISYIKLSGVLSYDTVSDMQSATNLVNGSTAKTLGKNNYLDGKGRYYKIRNIEAGDVVDGTNIIQITSDPTNTLIAELIPEETVSDIQNIKTTIEPLVSKKYIFIGDSYNTTDTPPGGVPIVPWSSKVVDFMDLTSSDYYNSGVSGAGWAHGTTFLTQLQTLSASITNKDKITDIIVCGGINDMVENDSDVYDAMAAFSSYCATNYPNAMVHVGMISWAKNDNARTYLRRIVGYYNQSIPTFPNMCSIGNAHQWFHSYELMYQPDGHPNAYGSSEIGFHIANYLKGGQDQITWNGILSVIGNGDLVNLTTGVFDVLNGIDGGNVTIEVRPYSGVSYLPVDSKSIVTDTTYEIGEFVGTSQYFWFNNDNKTDIIQTGTANILNSSNQWISLAYILTSYQRKVYITFRGLNTSGNITVSNITRIYLTPQTKYTTIGTMYC